MKQLSWAFKERAYRYVVHFVWRLDGSIIETFTPGSLTHCDVEWIHYTRCLFKIITGTLQVKEIQNIDIYIKRHFFFQVHFEYLKNPFVLVHVHYERQCHLPLLLCMLCIITTSRCFKCVFLKWLILLDVVAWRLSLFLWALLSVASKSVSNNFGFIWFERGEIFWKETSKRLLKTGTILQLREHGRTDLWTYPFVRDVWMIIK